MNKQFSINAVFKVLSLCAGLAFGVLYLPFIFRSLGDELFGVYALVAVFIAYGGIMSRCLVTSINRYLTIGIGKSEREANVIFSSSLLVSATIALVQLAMFTAIIVFLPAIFQLPEDLQHDARLLFGGTGFAFVLLTFGSVFSASAVARNRLDLNDGAEVVRFLLRMVLIWLAFSCLGASLVAIAAVEVFVAMLLFIYRVQCSRHLLPFLSVSWKAVDFKLMRAMLSSSLWVLVNNLGALLYVSSNIWLLNRFLDVQDAGYYSVVLQMDSMMRQLANTFVYLVAPMVAISYSTGDLQKVVKLTNSSMKLMVFSLALVCSLCALNAEVIMSLWLGEEFTFLWMLLVVVVAPLVVNGSVLMLFQVQIVYDKLKIPALVTLLLGVVNVVSVYCGLNYFELGVVGVATITAVLVLLKNFVFTPLYTARITGEQQYHYFLMLTKGVLVFLCVVSLGIIFRMLVAMTDLINCFSSLLISVVAFYLIVKFFFTVEERTNLLSLIPSKIRRFL